MAVARWLGHSALTLALLGVVLVLADPARASWGQPVSTEHGSIPAAMLDQSWTPLPGHVLAALPQASPLAAESRLPSEPLVLTIVLNRSDQAAFDAFLREVQDPQSPSFRRFAAQRELAQRFGPSQAVYDGVLAYLQQNGFTLVEGSTNRLTLTVQGTREQVERAFNAPILDYQLNGRVFHANTTDPAVPASLAPRIQGIEGLNNLAVRRPRLARAPRDGSTPHAAPSPSTPMSIATAYNFGAVRTASGAPATGAGQIIGIVAYDAYFTSDVQSWLTAVGLCAASDTACINGFLGRLATIQLTGSMAPSGGAGETEVLLDIDTLIGMAPGASYRVYESCNTCPSSVSFQAMFNRMLGDGVTVISNSWGFCEPETTLASARGIDSVLQAASAAGISAFNASGDTGSTCDGFANAVDVPADAPNGIAVGGTTLQVGAGNAYQGETWWNSTCGGIACAGGFGVSVFFPVPSYQAGLASGGRSVPDLAADANPSTGISLFQADQGGLICCLGGTSMSTPEWAAGIALVNQALGHLTGNWNTVLYSQRTGRGFHPPSSMGSDFAHVGLGSFDLGALVGQSPCTARPNVGVTVVPSSGGRLLATIAAQTNAATPTNQLQAVQFTSATGAVVTSSGGAPIAVPSSPTLPTGATTFSFFVAQASPGQGATVSLTVTDGCGAWPTFVGGGPSAFPAGGDQNPLPTATPTPGVTPAAQAAASPTARPATVAGSSGTSSTLPTDPSVAVAICTPRPQLAVTTASIGPGRWQVTISAPAAAHDTLQALRFGSATNALVQAGGQSGSSAFTATLPSGTQQTTFTFTRVTAGQSATVPLTIVDSCGEWPTLVGSGAD